MKESQPRPEAKNINVAWLDYEGFSALYQDPNVKAARVIAFAYNNPFEKLLGMVRQGEEVDEVIQERSRVWVLLDDGGALKEVSISDVDIVGLAAPKMHKGEKDMRSYLNRILIEHSPLRGPFNKSSVPVLEADRDSVRNDQVSKRIFQLQKVLKTPGNKEWNKENYKRWREELERIFDRENIEGVSKNVEELTTEMMEEILQIENVVGTISNSNSYRILYPVKVSGVKYFSPRDVAKTFLAVYLKRGSGIHKWADVGPRVLKFSKTDEAFYTKKWREVQERASEAGVDLSMYGPKD